MGLIRLDDLPEELTPAQAVEAAYRADLDWVAERLANRLSVLVETDKALTQQLYIAVRDRLKSAGQPASCVLVTGQPRRRTERRLQGAGAADVPPSQRQAAQTPDGELGLGGGDRDEGYLRTFLNNLRAALEESIGRHDVVLVLPHLDLLTTTTKSGLTDLAKETLAWIHENPNVTLLGFVDPSFEVPKAVEDVFTVKYGILGLRREVLSRLLLRREARKLTDSTFNPYRFFKYVSGLNALRFRRLMRQFEAAPDYDPARPEAVERIYRSLREMTLTSSFEVPQVDLHRDIGGYATVKQQLEDDILKLLRRRDELTDDDSVAQIEEVIPKGLIFHGPPGTGKTYFAKAMATALDASILVVSGPELKEQWVGASEANLRRVFTQARRSAPSIIVFDELDSIASRRGMYLGSGVEHSMVNQLLTEMDGFRGDELVFVVGTTNYLASVDPALLRPGRFEMQIELPYPDEQDRREILSIYLERFGLSMSPEVVDYLIERTEGVADYTSGLRYTGDHLYALCRALKRRELREGGFAIGRREVDEALTRRQHLNLQPTADELRTIAYHEAGHAVCAEKLEHTPPVRTVSIRPGELNTPSLGIMLQQARENKLVITREELADQIATALGGRLAEELCLGRISVGAQNDLAQVTAIARAMTEELGMGPTLGNQAVRLPGAEDRLPISGATAARIDDDVAAIIHDAEQRARAVLQAHRPLLERLAGLLLEHQCLEDEMLARALAAPA